MGLWWIDGYAWDRIGEVREKDFLRELFIVVFLNLPEGSGELLIWKGDRCGHHIFIRS